MATSPPYIYHQRIRADGRAGCQAQWPSLGPTDASVIAIPARLNLAEVATLDRRHFAVVRPAHVGTLTLLP